MIFYVFGLFLTSWRSGRCLKTFLEVVRFISTEYEPVTIHQPSNSPDFYDFWLILFRPTFQFSTFFEKVGPVCLLKPSPSVENAPMMIIWLWAFHEKLEFETFFLRICRFLHCALPLVVKKHFLILSLLKQVLKGFIFVLRNLNAPDSFILRKYRLSQNHIPQLI